MDLQLDNKLALVTASSGGIGFQIARALTAEGAQVIINGRSQAVVDAAMAKLVAEFPVSKPLPLVADNGTPEGAEATLAAYPEVDILVNNLGIYEVVSFFDETDEMWQRLFEVNILSGVRLSRHYFKGMLGKGQGRVIFISSECGLFPGVELAAYSATKSMQLSLSRSLAQLTKGTEVTVNSVLPGSTRTEGVATMLEGIYPGVDPDEASRRYATEHRPLSLLNRLMEPNEVADLVAFVCSPRASSVNGAALRVDGGLVRYIG